MKKILTVIGARPQFIKAAVLSRVIANKEDVQEVIVHTGQHFDHNMSDVFFEEMDIPHPDYNLNINGLSHGAMTGQMLEKIEEVLLKEKPDCVVVYGDTNSTLAGALAAKKMHIKVAHIEAGLRSNNIKMPEEVNRILTDRISDLLFCPTNSAVKNLENEGYPNLDCRVYNSGDVMLDAAFYYSKKAQKPRVDLPGRFVVSTIHRGENTDDVRRLNQIFEALEEISLSTPVVLPMHPRTRSCLDRLKYDFAKSNITITDPISYFEMIYLLSNAEMVITDSGGLQKEAFFFKKHCLVARDETEWVELIDHGYNMLCGANVHNIVTNYHEIANSKTKLSFSSDLYGNGEAGQKIYDRICEAMAD
ncbi:MAG: UDP-N-acetylglucosamine 2-epimerase (non-hydrolyzing) [Cyclobacteriaceae bacterium]